MSTAAFILILPILAMRNALTVWVVIGPLWLASLLWLLDGRVSSLSIGLATTTTLLLFPWPFVKSVCIPLGLVRLSWALTHLAHFSWGRDLKGGALVAAVLAVTHGQRPARNTFGRLWRRAVVRAGDRTWALDRVQRHAAVSLGSGLAMLVLAADDDDDRRTDAIADALRCFDPDHAARAGRRLLAEHALWVAARDDGRPFDERVRAILGIDAHGSPSVRFCQAIVQRRAPARLGDSLACGWWWLWAPRRRRSWAVLVGREPILRTKSRPLTPEPARAPDLATGVNDDDDVALAAAAARHAELTARREVTLDDVIALAELWQRGLPTATDWLKRRALVFKLDGDACAAALVDDVQASLRGHVERLDLSASDVLALPALLQEVVAEVRSERLDALEMSVASWRQRLEDGVDRRGLDEFLEWVALRTLSRAVAATGRDARFIAWETCHWVQGERAARLWNNGTERVLGNAVFRALLEEARAVGDSRASEMHAANVACGV
jgi:hypothetical protein